MSLAVGHRLQRYQIERLSDRSRFDLTYLARDLNTGAKVVVKEYFPQDLAARDRSGFVHPLRDDLEEPYHGGLELFLAEAHGLAQIHHPNIVRVVNAFLNRNTAYMVMEYEAGRPLAELFEAQRTLAEPELTAILLPLLDGLESVHQSGLLHRDIRPAQILVRPDKTPVLLGFCAVRHAVGGAVGGAVPSEFSAPEQYYDDAREHGPWTDLYGLAATAYRGVAGFPPVNAWRRSQALLQGAEDPLVAASHLGGTCYSGVFLQANDHALTLNPAQRPQTSAAWRGTLSDCSGRPARNSLSDAFLPAAGVMPETAFGTGPTAATESSEGEAAHRSRPSLALPGVLVLTVGVISVFTLLSWQWVIPGDAEHSGTDSTPQDSPVASGGAVGAIDAPDGPGGVPLSEAVAEERVSGRLAEARTALNAGRIMEPPENNAWQKYKAVLARVPGQEEANRGLDDIATKLIRSAREAMSQGRFDEATRLLNQAAEVRPGLGDLKAARGELTVHRRMEKQRLAAEARLNQRARAVDHYVQEARRALRRSRWDKAEEALEQAASLAPEAVEVKKLRAEVLVRRAQAASERTVREPAETAAPGDHAADAGSSPPIVTAGAAELQRPESVAGPPSKAGGEKLTEASTAQRRAGPTVRIQRASTSRASVSPGESVEFSTEYQLSLPSDQKRELVEVRWVLKREGRRLGEEGVVVSMADAGGNVAKNEFSLPASMKPGRYTVEHRVEVDGHAATARSHFTVAAGR